MSKINKGIIIRIILAVMFMFAIGAYIYCLRYAIYANEDFLIASKLGMTNSNRVTNGFVEVFKNMYKKYTGCYFSIFLAYIINPFRISGYLFLRLTLFVSFVFFLFSVSYCLRKFARTLKMEEKEEQMLQILIFTLILFFKNYAEVYLWWTGVIFYEIPLSIMLIGFAFLIDEKKSFIRQFVAFLCLVLAAGGAHGLGAFELYLVGVILLKEFKTYNKVSVWSLITILAVAITLVISFEAPGTMLWINDYSSTPPGLLKSVFCAACMVESECKELFQGTPLLFLGMGCFGMGFFLSTDVSYVSYKKYIFLIFAPFFTLVPITYARRYDSIVEVPERCELIIDLFIFLFTLLLFLNSGKYLRKYKKNEYENSFKKITLSFTALAVVPMFIAQNAKCVILDMGKNILNHTISEYSDKWSTVYYICNQSEGALTIEIDFPEVDSGVTNVKLKKATTYEKNVWLAEFYELEGVSLIHIGDE